jgi:hypothetical protein
MIQRKFVDDLASSNSSSHARMRVVVVEKFFLDFIFLL